MTKSKLRNNKSRLITLRLPHDLESRIKELADQQGLKWQSTIKKILCEATGIHETNTSEDILPVKRFRAAVEKLRGDHR